MSMSDDDILDLASKSKLNFFDGVYYQFNKDSFFTFARAIAAKEREACAALCDEVYRIGRVHQAQDCATAIRARGE